MGTLRTVIRCHKDRKRNQGAKQANVLTLEKLSQFIPNRMQRESITELVHWRITNTLALVAGPPMLIFWSSNGVAQRRCPEVRAGTLVSRYLCIMSHEESREASARGIRDECRTRRKVGCVSGRAEAKDAGAVRHSKNIQHTGLLEMRVHE